MFNIKLIQNVLKDYVDKSVKKFIIYPFGVNGVNVRNILRDYFDLEPCFIVDNTFSKYHEDIIDSKVLKSVYQVDMHVVFTIEDAGLNAEMLKELSDYIPHNRIINLYDLTGANHETTKAKNVKFDRKGFRLSEFLPKHNNIAVRGDTSGKIKVRISHRHPTCWNGIRTVYQEFSADPSFDVLLIISNRVDKITKATVKQVQTMGYRYIIWNKYHVEEDRPDILVLTSAYDSESVGRNCRIYTKLIVMYSLFLLYYNKSLSEYWDIQQKALNGCSPDYYLYDSLLYRQLRNTNFFSSKIIETGNAKFDEIFQAIQKREYWGKWKKLEGRPTILWATSHGIWDKEFYLNLTFDLYARVIFQYAEEHQELGLIFRPHGSFLDEMISCGFWCEKDIERIKKYCDDTPNVVFDETDSYKTAISIADGIITDAYCGIVCSAFPTLKPICALYRTNKDQLCSEELLKNCYSAFEEKEVIDFFDMIKNGKDPMYELRKSESGRYVKSFDGENGRRIKNVIVEKYFEREN